MIMLMVNATAALVAIWVSICAINRMSRRTPNQVRLAYILMGVGAMSGLLAPCMSSRPYGWTETLIMVLIAVLGVSSHYYWAREKHQHQFSGHHADRKH